MFLSWASLWSLPPSSATVVANAPVDNTSQEDPRLAEARTLLFDKEEKAARRGGQICVQVNNVDAVVLLLSVLEETAGRG
ncbi:MAG: hypothetical protein QF615_08045, partial [Planctomycetota bacterium]|nr:hypothetical protein [Planctomycetota bacterium]